MKRKPNTQTPPNRGISRRKLLCGAAATAAFAPFIPLRESEAQEVGVQRLLNWYTPAGTIEREWTPTGTGSDFELKRILAPLEAQKERLLVISGLKFHPAEAGGTHKKGPQLMFAGSNTDPATGWGTGISIDQVFAQKVGDQTPFRSIVMGVLPSGKGVRHRISYAGNNQPIVPSIDPATLFDQIFSGFQVPDELAALRAKRKSVLDLVRGELTQLKPKYGLHDQRKIDAHLEAIRAIEVRLAPRGACAVPEPGAPLDLDNQDLYPEVGKQLMDILLAAFVCDQTRVASLQWSGTTDTQHWTWLGIDERHHLLSHQDGDEAVQEQLIQINTWYSEQLAYFMGRLGEIEEADGTALDNTLIFVGNDMGRGGAHKQEDIPILLAGGANGRLEMGRHITAPGEANNRLLVSVLHTLGMEDYQSFGDTDPGTGPLAAI